MGQVIGKIVMIYCDIREIPIFRDIDIQMEPGIYCAKSFSEIPHWMGPLSYRIWHEDNEGRVSYAKAPANIFTSEIDMKEFMWAKLTARPLECST